MDQLTSKNCTITGYLYGVVCRQYAIYDILAGAVVYAVPSPEKKPTMDSLGRFTPPQEKRGAGIIPCEKLDAILNASKPLKDRCRDDGGFCFADARYEGGLLDIYVRVDSVPTPKLDKSCAGLEHPICLALGTYAPRKFGDRWYLSLRIPAGVWCKIRRMADAWVIAGKVVSCNGGIPLGGVKVSARDVDLVQQDHLGAATTNTGGIFRIDYLGAAYRKGTWLNVELIGGPDVYFNIEDADGNSLLDEPPSKGRSAGREDVGACFCLELCAQVKEPAGPDGVEPGVWTGIGTQFTIPDSSDLNDFDADGYAGAAKYAFTGSIRMTGSAPIQSGSGNPMEYRFRVSETTSPNGGSAVSEGNFTTTVGVGPGEDLFFSTRIGQMVRYSPFKIVSVYAQEEDLDPEGWLDVHVSIERTFLQHPTLTPADLADFDWVDLDGLMAINTAELTTAADVPNGAASAGDAVPAGNHIPIEKRSIRFELREVIDKAISNFVYWPSNGTTLNAIVINNNPPFRALSTADHLSGHLCDPLSGSVEIAYTLHHPHVRAANISVRSNDGVYNQNLSDTNLPVSGNVSPSVNHLFNGNTPLPGTLHKCTYLVSMSVLRRLHSGDGAVDADWRQTSFYFEP